MAGLFKPCVGETRNKHDSMSDRSEPIVTRTTEQPCTLLAVMANDDVMDLLFEHVDYEDWQRLDRLNKTARGAINSMIARNWDK
jgi:hypothetical protein